MKQLTAIIITKNEEEMIVDCIRSVKFADEILVVDSGSTDRTVARATKEGAQVIAKPFTSYADQRNAGMKKARGKWLVYIDADERITEELEHELKEISSKSKDDSTYSAYQIPRENYYLGNHKWPHIEHLERLFLKEDLTKWAGDVHEHAEHMGKTGILSGRIIHYTHRDLASMTDKTSAWADIESELLVAAHHPPMNALRFVRIMATKFMDSYVKQSGWRAGAVGLIESMYQAYSYFIIYARLWEKQQKTSD